MAATGPAVASAQLAGTGRTSPVAVPVVRDAYSAKATSAVHGWFDKRDGRLNFEFSIEDLSTHRMTEAVFGDGDLLEVAEMLAKQFEPSPRPFSTSNLQAVEAWGRHDYAQAVALDPEFGAAWLALSQQQAAANQTQEALATVNRALGEPDLKSPLDRARLDVLSATLRGDEGARDQALLELVRLLPNDAALARQLAERFYNTRRFDSAVRLYREVTRIEPQDALSFNMLAYSLYWGGDEAGARRAVETYKTFPGQEANAADSEGEFLFMSGQFEEAGRLFLQAHEKAPNLLQGGDLLKAAYCHWLAGDLDGADKRFAEYEAFRQGEPFRDPWILWRRAAWLFSTDRRQEAISRLRSATGPVAQIARVQLQVWEHPEALPTDVEILKNAYRASNPAQDGLIRTLYAQALSRAGQTAEARELVQQYPLPDIASNPANALNASWTYPLFLPLRKQLLP